MNFKLNFKIAIRTMKDNLKISLLLTLIFMGLLTMYSASYPAFKDSIDDMLGSLEGGGFEFFRGFEHMDTYAGFVAMEGYELFWILILGILIGFIAASLISKEIEAKTIDILMSNPVSRKQLVFEKYLGMVPFILLINIAVLLTVYGATIAVGEEINLGYLSMTHVISILYFLTIASIGLLVSVIIDEKMKASIFTIAIIVGMFIFDSISRLVPDYEVLGYASLTHYYIPTNILISGTVDIAGVVVLISITIVCLIISMFYFERRNIVVS